MVRRFVTQVAVEIALRRVIARDLAGADRILDLARGPLAAVAGATPVDPEATRDANSELELTVASALVAAMSKRATALPPAGQIGHARMLFEARAQHYAAPLRAEWNRALVAAGYPKA